MEVFANGQKALVVFLLDGHCIWDFLFDMAFVEAVRSEHCRHRQACLFVSKRAQTIHQVSLTASLNISVLNMTLYRLSY